MAPLLGSEEAGLGSVKTAAGDEASGGIKQITSTGGTVAVTDPTGPVTNLEVVSAGFGPAPPAVAKGNVASAGVASTQARSDQVNAQFLVADWALATVRTFLFDPVNGNDANQGFSDVAGPYNAATQAKKTVAGLQAVFPSHFAGRVFRLIIASGTVATTDLDQLLGGAVGIGSGSVVRPTSTSVTGGCTAFDDSTADRTYVGSQTATGCNAAGYNPTAGATTTAIPCQLNGGGAAGLAAEPASPLMWRVRFDAATATAALRNVCRSVEGVPTTASLTVDALPAVPAVGDVFYLEMSGLTYSTIRLGGLTVEPTSGGGLSTGLQLVGIRSSGTFVIEDGMYSLALCGAGTYQTRVSNLQHRDTYRDPVAAATFTVGGGLRSEGSILVQTNMVAMLTRQAAVTAGSFLSYGQLTLGGVFGTGLLMSFSDPNAVQLGASSVVLRCLGASNLGAIETIGSLAAINGAVTVTGAGAKPAITFTPLSGGATLVLSASLSGATGNNDVGLDVTGVRGATIALLSTPTVTGALGDVRLGGGKIVSWAQLAATGITDSNGNRFISASAPLCVVKSFSGVIITSGGGPTFGYLTDVGITAVAIAGNEAAPMQYPTSARLITRLRGGAPLGTGAQPPTYTLYKNGVATAMTVTLPAGAGAGTNSADLAHPILFADGDTFDVRADFATTAEGNQPVCATLEGPC